MITGNKGEWSEVYTLLKVISDKQLFAGDSNLNNKIKSQDKIGEAQLGTTVNLVNYTFQSYL